MTVPVLPPGTPGGDALMLALTQIEQRLKALEVDGSGYPPLRQMRGALVTKAATQVGANFTAGSPVYGAYVSWDTVTYDTDKIFNAATPTRLTVPAGITRVRVSACASVDNVTASDWFYLVIDKNKTAAGASSYTGEPQQAATLSNVNVRLSASSAIIPVTPGDYFELRLYNATDTSVDVSSQSWFAMELLA